MYRVGVYVSDKKWKEMTSRGVFTSSDAIQYIRMSDNIADESLDYILSKFTAIDSVPKSPRLRVVFNQQKIFHDRYSLITELGAGEVPVPATSLCSDKFSCDSLMRKYGKAIMKTRKACGSPETHWMRIVDSVDHIRTFTDEYICQQFIPHKSDFFKIFVIHNHFFGFTRKSVDMNVGEFSSQELTKTNFGNIEIDYKFEGIIQETCAITKSNLLSIDIVVHESTGQLFVVDVNYFPTYKELGSYLPRLVDEYCLQSINR